MTREDYTPYFVGTKVCKKCKIRKDVLTEFPLNWPRCRKCAPRKRGDPRMILIGGLKLRKKKRKEPHGD